MNTQTIELTKPVQKEAPQQEEEPPLPKPVSQKLLNTAMRKLIDGWVKMMGQGVAV